MRVRLVFGVVGRLVGPFAVAFVPPLLMALFDRDLLEAAQFLLASFATLLIGLMMARAGQLDPVLRRAEALAVVTLTWLMVGTCGAIPYLFAGLSPVDAMFESISGLTTTGATILTDWDQTRAFFLWRAMTQWFGGLGVIALFVVILPRLGIAGRQIFFFEASTAPSEAVSPSVRRSASKLWLFYAGLTVLMMSLLVVVARTPLYEALIHSLTTLSAGGFSNSPTSLVKDAATPFATPATQWIMIPFMFLAGASYPLFFAGFLRKSPRHVLRDGEFKLYAMVALTATVVLTGVIWSQVPTAEQAVRDSAFQVASLISSAGFASIDYEAAWGSAAKGVLIVVMILGGCAGSAAGGAKQVRFLLLFKYIGRELTRVLHPRAVLPLRHGGEPVPPAVIRAVTTLVMLYVFGYAVLTIALFMIGVPVTEAARAGTQFSADDNEALTTAGSAAIACLSNVGPALGPAGPMGSYADFPIVAKILLMLAMLVGRLEIVTVLALLHPDVWRHISFGKPERPKERAWTVFDRGADRGEPEARKSPGVTVRIEAPTPDGGAPEPAPEAAAEPEAPAEAAPEPASDEAGEPDEPPPDAPGDPS